MIVKPLSVGALQQQRCTFSSAIFSLSTNSTVISRKWPVMLMQDFLSSRAGAWRIEFPYRITGTLLWVERDVVQYLGWSLEVICRNCLANCRTIVSTKNSPEVYDVS